MIRLAFCTDLRRLEEPRAAAVDILVAPELADGGYAALARGRGTHTPGDAYFGRFAALSRGRALTVIAASARVQDGGRAGAANTAMVFERGRAVHRYDKIHLFGPTGDPRYFRPGAAARARVLPRRPWRPALGVIICYDLRFPELARRLALGGMDLLVVPARWPAVRAEAWRTLLKARAIENQIFTAGCNAAGREGGPSYVFDPLGAPVREDRSRAARGWKEFLLDPERLRTARRLFNTRREARLA